MASQAQAYQPSSVDVSVIRGLDGAVYQMVMAIVAKRGDITAPYLETRAFQEQWNLARATIDRVAKGLGHAPVWFQLKEDGLYGPNTAHALSLITGVPTPTKTASIPAWYVKNKALINSYASASVSQTKAQPQATVAAAQAQASNPAVATNKNTQVIISQARGGTLTQQNTPTTTMAFTPATQSALVSQGSPATAASDQWHATVGQAQITSAQPSGRQIVSQTSTKPPAALKSQAAAADDISKMASDLSFGDEAVPVSKPKSNVGLYAVGAGLLAAAGVFTYMVARKRSPRRHAA